MTPHSLAAALLALALLAGARMDAASASTLGPADALLARGRYAEAAAAYASLGPQASRVRESWRRNNWGLALLRAGRPAAAVGQFRAAVEADPRNFVARANLGAAYEQVGDVTKALAVYRRALAVLKAGLRQGAEAADGSGLDIAPTPAAVATPVERACALGPRRLKAVLHRAAALLGAGQYAEARAVYASIGRVRPAVREGWLLNNWGLCDLRLARPDLARERLERSVSVDPANRTAWYNLAVADEQLGLVSEAAAAFARGGGRSSSVDPQRLELARVELEFDRLRARRAARK